VTPTFSVKLINSNLRHSRSAKVSNVGEFLHILTISKTGGYAANGDKTEERKSHDEQCCQVLTVISSQKEPAYIPVGDKENKDI
jgi:hypothetical protein